MYIYGRNPIMEALKAGRAIEKIYIRYGAEERFVAAIRREAGQRGVPCTTADRRKFAALERELRSGPNAAQGVIATIVPVTALSVTDLIDRVYQASDTPLLVLIDGISDPHNLGAIVRSAECAGAAGVVVPERGGAPLASIAMKAAAGAFEHIAIARSGNLAKAALDIRQAGFMLVGTSDRADRRYTDQTYDGATALVIGSEGAGIHPDIRRHCEALVSIPMAGKITSLNASVAAGVVLFEIARQRSDGEGSSGGAEE